MKKSITPKINHRLYDRGFAPNSDVDYYRHSMHHCPDSVEHLNAPVLSEYEVWVNRPRKQETELPCAMAENFGRPNLVTS